MKNKIVHFFQVTITYIFYPIVSEIIHRFLSRYFFNSPLDSFIMSNFLVHQTGHFSRNYQEFDVKRIARVLELHDIEWFKGKRILDLGGGIGTIGAFFASLGAEVISAEYRTSNRNFAKIAYRNIPSFHSVFFDGEKDFSTSLTGFNLGNNGKFDLILCFGFLEVIHNFENVLENCIKFSDEIILETMVCDSEDPRQIVWVDMSPHQNNWWGGMPQDINDHPLHGKSTRPSPALIENFFLSHNFKVERYFTSDLNSQFNRYDWRHKNNNRVFERNILMKINIRRFWRFYREKL